MDAAVARTLDEFGRIDLLVNNAGYRIRARLEDLPRAEWDAMIATNLTGVFLFSQAVGRVMIRRQSGKIVNVGTTLETSVNGLYRMLAEITGFTGQPLFGPQPEGELRRISLDIELAKEALAWHPWTHLEDGLRETVAYLRG